MLNFRNYLKPFVICNTLLASNAIFADSNADILERIRPLGKVNVKEAITPVATPAAVVAQPQAAAAPVTPPAAAPTAAAPTPTIVVATSASVGQKTYESICFACHAVGAAGSPKFGDKAAWGPRIAKGLDALFHSALNGTVRGMPPRGGCGTCSDADLKAAMEYMVAHGK